MRADGSIERVRAPDPRPYHGWNPLTKLTLAAWVTAAVLVFGGYVIPSVLLLVAVLPGANAARVLGPVVRTAALATLPLAIAVGVVQAFGGIGSTVLFRLGPVEASLEGLDAAAQTALRLFVMAAALLLFGRTTRTADLVADLERRGVSARFTFALASTLGAVPALVEQARTVRDAQRARGLDIDGGLRRRLAGILPLAGPVILGVLHGVEARSLALEARAFGRPGRRHLLWSPPDTAVERVVRWALLLALAALLVAAGAGVLPRIG